MAHPPTFCSSQLKYNETPGIGRSRASRNSLERASHSLWRGDMVISDAFESDQPEACLHHQVDSRHAEQKGAFRLEDAHHLAQALLVFVQMLEDREADHQLKLRRVIG